MQAVWLSSTGAAIKLRFQVFSTGVLSTERAKKFVTQRLTVLLSYSIVAYVPLLDALVEWKIAIVQTELN